MEMLGGFRFLLAIFLVFSVCADADESVPIDDWIAFSSEMKELGFKHPKGMTVRQGKGNSCMNEVCHAVEYFDLMGRDEVTQRVNNPVHISVQKQIIPKNMSLDQYRETEMKALFGSEKWIKIESALTKTPVTIGGLSGVRVRGQIPHTTWTSKRNERDELVPDESTVREIMKPEDKVFLSTKAGDLIIIANSAPQTSFDNIYESILASVSFDNR